VDVNCELRGDFVQVTVHNVGESRTFSPVARVPGGGGLGLESTRERMTAAFGDSATVETSAPSTGEFVVRLTFVPKRPVVLRPNLAAVS
jgi:signal transduction histidine kinase